MSVLRFDPSSQQETAKVLTFTGKHRGDVPGKSPATQLTERLAAACAGEDVVACTDALVRMLAAICCCNAINLTEAVETAQLIGLDLDEMTRGMMAPEGEGA